MNIRSLRFKIEQLETGYQQVDKTSFEALANFMGQLSDTYTLFQSRERYKKSNLSVPHELKIFFDANDSELEVLSKKVLRIADDIDRRFNSFRSSQSSSLVPDFLSFFVSAGSDGRVSSSDIYNQGMNQSRNSGGLSRSTILKKYKTDDINTALRRAAYQGSVPDVEVLVNQFGADVKSKSASNGFTALDWAYSNSQMQPQGVFNTLCWLGADQSVLGRLLEKYVLDDESEFPEKNIALARAMQQHNQQDIDVLVNKYKADPQKAELIIDGQPEASSFGKGCS